MSRKYVFLLIVGLLVVGLDQWSKFLAVKHLTPGIADAHLGHPATLDERASALESVSGGSAWGHFYSDVKHPCRRMGANCAVVPVVDGFWNWRYVENPGAAWGLLANADESIRVPFFFVISVIAVGFIIMFFRKLEPEQKLTVWALSLVFGGALGNLIDRLHLNYVIDFIDWYVGTHHWPTFNVADAAISVGVGLLLLEWILDAAKERRAGGAAAEAEGA